MTFNTAHFALLLLLTGIGYALAHQIKRYHWPENLVLLSASLFFYGFWDYRFLFLLLVSSGIDYIAGLGIARPTIPLKRIFGVFALLVCSTVLLCAPVDWQGIRTLVFPAEAYAGGWSEPKPFQGFFLPDGDWLIYFGATSTLAFIFAANVIGLRLRGDRRRLYYLCVSMICNLGLLGFFKYYDFFIDSASVLLHQVGLGMEQWRLNILVPVGISFYTFQTMSYTIDIYRGEMEPRDNLLDFMLFVSFFPQLVAGPIERAATLLPQLERRRPFLWDQAQTGVYLIGWGFFKKIFIADNLARIVEMGYGGSVPLSGPVALFATYAFYFQIYCDFSAYSDIARGTARLLGVELMVNFNIPFACRNMSDFWRRWHISLSTWLRDYLFIPLGGSRGTTLFVARNVMITMTLAGLWHGARLNFILFGAYIGVIIIIHRASVPLLKAMEPKGAITLAAWKLLCWASTLFLQLLPGFLMFRSDSMAQICTMFAALPTGWRDLMDGPGLGMAARLVWFTWPLVLVEILQYRTGNLMEPLTWPWPVRTAFYLLIFYLTVIFGEFNNLAFIYFQF